MRENDIYKVLNALDVKKVNKAKQHLVFPCVLAPWTHSKGTDNSPSMEIRISEDIESLYHCFACKSSGTLSGLLLNLNSYTGGKYIDLERWVIQKESDISVESVDAIIAEAAYPYRTYAAKLGSSEPSVFSESEMAPFLGKVPQYILDRGIPLEICKKWSLGHDEKENRLIFPVYDWIGNLVGVVGRTTLPNTKPRYKNYWNFPKSKYLYGEHLLSSEVSYVVVVEGMISALAVYSAGLRNVVGLMGSMLSADQVQRIITLGRTIYLMLDMDTSGNQCRSQFQTKIAKHFTIFDAVLPRNDPGECSFDEIRASFEEAKILSISS